MCCSVTVKCYQSTGKSARNTPRQKQNSNSIHHNFCICIILKTGLHSVGTLTIFLNIAILVINGKTQFIAQILKVFGDFSAAIDKNRMINTYVPIETNICTLTAVPTYCISK